jgi:hypothetical protein
LFFVALSFAASTNYCLDLSVLVAQLQDGLVASESLLLSRQKMMDAFSARDGDAALRFLGMMQCRFLFAFIDLIELFMYPFNFFHLLIFIYL